MQYLAVLLFPDLLYFLDLKVYVCTVEPLIPLHSASHACTHMCDWSGGEGLVARWIFVMQRPDIATYLLICSPEMTLTLDSRKVFKLHHRCPDSIFLLPICLQMLYVNQTNISILHAVHKSLAYLFLYYSWSSASFY